MRNSRRTVIGEAPAATPPMLASASRAARASQSVFSRRLMKPCPLTCGGSHRSSTASRETTPDAMSRRGGRPSRLPSDMAKSCSAIAERASCAGRTPAPAPRSDRRPDRPAPRESGSATRPEYSSVRHALSRTDGGIFGCPAGCANHDHRHFQPALKCASGKSDATPNRLAMRRE